MSRVVVGKGVYTITLSSQVLDLDDRNSNSKWTTQPNPSNYPNFTPPYLRFLWPASHQADSTVDGIVLGSTDNNRGGGEGDDWQN